MAAVKFHRMSGRRFATVIVVVALGVLAVLLTVTFEQSSPPSEPAYQGMSLRQWIAAEPNLPVTSHDDIVAYRRAALHAMGEPAIRYLQWMITHPGRALEQQVGWVQRLRASLPKPLQKLLPSRHVKHAGFRDVVFALQLIGPKASRASPDLVHLWESNGNSAYAGYNGFPLTLAELGDASPEVLAALHRHFNSSDRLHRALCAFAAWRLNPNDSEAIAIISRELVSTDSQTHLRITLLDTFARYSTNTAPFLPEIRALIARNLTEYSFEAAFSAEAAWRILNTAEPAKQVIQLLATAATKSGASAHDVNQFAGAALTLAEVPGVSEIAIPALKELGHFSDASAASFVARILARLEARRTNAPQSVSK